MNPSSIKSISIKIKHLKQSKLEGEYSMFFLFLFVVGFLFQDASDALYACNQEKNACGCSHRPVITTKIVGGEAAVSHSWGWLASLRHGDVHFCGGTILNEWFVITAAHCIADTIPLLPNITVCVGIDYLSDICSQSVSVANVTIHHSFNNRTIENDIALLRLATPLNFSDPFIARICLLNITHSFDYPETGTAVIIIGWGRTRIDGTANNELRQATLKIIDKSAQMCATNTFNSRLQLCAYSPEKDTCRGDSGGPLMAFTASKQWELVGLTSYGRGCANHEYAGTYTRLTTYQEFIASVMNGTYTIPTPRTCSCRCPYGRDQGVAYTSDNSPEACVDACRAVTTYPCDNFNTYACLGTDCVYSVAYNHTCSCQCPFGSNQTLAYTTENSTEACVNACIAIPSNICIRSNTYACLEDNCTYSSSYDNTSVEIPARYECWCQCPYGSNETLVLTKVNSIEVCVYSCRAVSPNSCFISNTYACLGNSCAYFTGYVNSSLPETDSYRCSCQCPYGSDQGAAYTSINSAAACVSGCTAVPTNQCNFYNTYACLDNDCVYSPYYVRNCSCQCPFGSNETFAYTFGNSTEACVNACVAHSSNDCIDSNTYACLEDNCTYSSSYDNSSLLVPVHYECSCQCPYGSNESFTFTKRNSTESCIEACTAVPSNPCTMYNTYACLGTNCAYSSEYENSSSTETYSYRCSCQCPYGYNQRFVYINTNSAEACVNACIAVPSNNCFDSNTYVCLEDNCTYSNSYDNVSAIALARYRCACYCPHGSYRGVALSKVNVTEACVNACIAVPSKPCLSSNTYACLGNNCTYSNSYSYVSTATPVRYRCSCQCPYGYLQGVAFTTENSVEACADACQAVRSNPCVPSNTYACLGTNCTYSSSYNNISRPLPSDYKCVCQCPYESDEGFAYAEENSAAACVNACKAVPWNACDSSNTYACLGTDCVYSNSYIR